MKPFFIFLFVSFAILDVSLATLECFDSTANEGHVVLKNCSYRELCFIGKLQITEACPDSDNTTVCVKNYTLQSCFSDAKCAYFEVLLKKRYSALLTNVSASNNKFLGGCCSKNQCNVDTVETAIETNETNLNRPTIPLEAVKVVPDKDKTQRVRLKDLFAPNSDEMMSEQIDHMMFADDHEEKLYRAYLQSSKERRHGGKIDRFGSIHNQSSAFVASLVKLCWGILFTLYMLDF